MIQSQADMAGTGGARGGGGRGGGKRGRKREGGRKNAAVTVSLGDTEVTPLRWKEYRGLAGDRNLRHYEKEKKKEKKKKKRQTARGAFSPCEEHRQD